MGLFDKMKEPVFLKDSSKDEKLVEELESLVDLASKDAKKQIEKEIKRIKFGIAGEKKIEFELRNSHIPMFVIHDLYLEHDGLSAQIDYLVLTKRRYFIIECKNLYGNLTICDNGDFIRTITQNGVTKKHRIYSPITQNRRHLEIIKKIRAEEKNNFIIRALFEKNFYENYRSLVVLANYNGILNTKYAPKDIAKQVINADQLINYIRKVNNEKGVVDYSEKDLEKMAQYFMELDRENPVTYLEKYKRLITEPSESEDIDTTTTNGTSEQHSEISEIPICKRCGAPMVKRIAKRGANKGNQFWGCSTYPKCHFILES